MVAFVDALLEPDFALRTFDFDPTWGEGERHLSIRSGEGDHAFVRFGSEGVLVRGRHREAHAIPEHELFAGLPKALEHVRDEPAFQLGGDSFAVWRLASDDRWTWAVDPSRGGIGALLSVLLGSSADVAEYAARYHEQRIDPLVLEELVRGSAVGAEWLERLGVRTPQRRAFELAKRLGFRVERKAAGKRSESVAKPSSKPKAKSGPTDPSEDDETLGEAEFKVIRVGDETRLVVAGKVQLRASKPGLYLELIESVRAALRSNGA